MCLAKEKAIKREHFFCRLREIILLFSFSDDDGPRMHTTSLCKWSQIGSNDQQSVLSCLVITKSFLRVNWLLLPSTSLKANDRNIKSGLFSLRHAVGTLVHCFVNNGGTRRSSPHEKSD